MQGKDIHVVPHPNGWAGKTEGKTKATFTTSTKTEAVAKARDIAILRGAELVIHNKNGRIADSDSFGNDPCPPRDKKH